MDSRTRILDAAEHAFADKGLAGARVAAIAEEAGVNKAMVYYYWKSKAELHRAVLERVFAEIGALGEALHEPDDSPPADRLRQFAVAYNRVLRAHPRFERIVLRNLLDDADAVVALVAPRLQAMLPAVMQQVVSGQASGEVNPALSPPLVAPALVAPMLFFALARPMLTRVTGMPEEALAPLWEEHVLEMLMNGLVAREETP